MCTGTGSRGGCPAHISLTGPADAATVSALAVIGAVRVRSGDDCAQEVLDAARDAVQYALPGNTVVLTDLRIQDQTLDPVGDDLRRDPPVDDCRSCGVERLGPGQVGRRGHLQLAQCGQDRR